MQYPAPDHAAQWAGPDNHSRTLIRRSGHAIGRQALVLGHVGDAQHTALDQSAAEHFTQLPFIL